MTTEQATETTTFIKHPAIRDMAVAALVSGKTFLCPDCGNIASAETGCFPCEEVKFAAQCAEHDVLTANAETFDPYENLEMALEEAMAGRAVSGGSRHSEL